MATAVPLKSPRSELQIVREICYTASGRRHFVNVVLKRCLICGMPRDEVAEHERVEVDIFTPSWPSSESGRQMLEAIEAVEAEASKPENESVIFFFNLNRR